MKRNLTGSVYLIHFNKPYKGTRHYVGFTTHQVQQRLLTHKKGVGAKLLKAVAAAGIGFKIYRTWDKVTRGFERKLKNHKNHKHYCPKCNKKTWSRYGINTRT